MASDVCCPIYREGNTAGHLLAPSLGVQSWVIPSFFTGIDIDPSLLVLLVDPSPYVFLGVPYPSYSSTDSSAQYAENIGPFPASSISCLKQPPHIPVPWEYFVYSTIASQASV
jgi:hypothetical protein